MKESNLQYLPRYITIKNTLKNQIESGLYKVGDFLPSEHQLSETFQVTRSTLRHSLQALKEEGLIEPIKGKGSRVCESTIEQGLLKLYTYGQNHILTSSKLLEIKEVHGNKNISDHLNLEVNTPVYEIRVLRHYEGQPFIIESSYLPRNIAQGIEEEIYDEAFVYHHIENHQKMKINHAEEHIKAEVANATEAELLNIKIGTPIFYTERTCFDCQERPIEFRKSIIRCDLVPFYTNVY